MHYQPVDHVISWALAVFLLIGAAVNGFATSAIRRDFVRWGYPRWFPYFTAILQLIAAVMLMFPRWRLIGAFLSIAVMLAAALTKARDRKIFQSLPAVIALIVSLATFILSL